MRIRDQFTRILCSSAKLKTYGLAVFYSKQTKFNRFKKAIASSQNRRLSIEKMEDRRVLAQFVVTTLNDMPINQSAGDGLLSLREAIEAANRNVSIDGSPVGSPPDFFSITDQIVFAVTGKIVLQAGELKVDQDVEIIGRGADQLTIDANYNSRVFNLTSGGIRLTGLTLTNGRARLSNSDGFGGGILNNGITTVKSIVISNCIADLDGGAIFGARFGSFSAIESSILNNIAGRNGGGMFSSGAGRFRNVTIAGNFAIDGGGLYRDVESNQTCESCTIVGNTAVQGGGIYQVSPIGLHGSIVAGNFGSANIDSNIEGPGMFPPGYQTYGLFGPNPSGNVTDGVNGNRIVSDWKTIVENDGLKPLVKLNGGTTPTILPLANGPAIEKGNPGYQATTVDQRGLPRIVDADNDGNAVVDIGAVELDPNIRVRISGASVNESASSLRFTINLGRAVPVGSTVSFQFSIGTGGNATANQDFTPVSRTFTLNSTSQIVQYVDIPILQDILVENDETFAAVLSDIQGGVIETGFSFAVGTIGDDDVAGFNVSKTATTVTEDGVTIVDTVSVVLTAPPVVNVAIILQNYQGGKPIAALFDPPSLVFTPSNWNVAQQASIKGLDDAFDDGDQVYSNGIYVSNNSYAAYKKAPVKQLAITNIDDDTRGVSVTKISSNTSETGDQATFTVKLLTHPYFQNNASAFSIPVSSSDPSEGTVSVSSLRFTFQNWEAPQTVTVTGVDDTEADGNVNYSIILGQIVADNSESVDYAGIDPEDVALSNTDNDSPTFDFGDAPNKTQSGFASDYPTDLSQNGARHLVTGLRLGANLDAEFDGAPNSQAGLTSGGDDGTGIADEDGVRVVASLVASVNSPTTASLSVNASAAAKLDAWIDFNQDGDWNDAGEQIFSTLTVASGINLLGFAIPAGSKSGNTFARFRLSSSGGLAPTGAAVDGEVEDYLLPILSSQTGAQAALSLPFAGSCDVIADSSELIVRQYGRELFRAPLAGLTLRLQGSSGDDVFNLSPSPTVAFGTILQFDGGTGKDSIRIVNSGSTLDFSGTNQTHIKSIESIDVTGSGANRLQLDLTAVNQAAIATGTLKVKHDENDTVTLGNNWKVSEPSFAGTTFFHVLMQGSAKVIVENTRPYRNPYVSTDVDRDDSTSPLDVLQIVNALNSNIPRSLNAPTSSSQLPNFAYLDADGDGSLSPLDALVLINLINSRGSGEGEQSNRGPASPDLFWSPIELHDRPRKKNAFSTAENFELCDQFFQSYE